MGAAAAVQRQLAAAWMPLTATAGGYAHIQADPAPSLYATAWSLRILAALGDPLPSGDAGRIAQTVEDALLKPDAADSAIPELERCRLAVQALTDLGRPVPTARISSTVNALRSGPLYRLTASQQPSWAATETAVQTLLLLHSAPPAVVAGNASDALASAGDGTALQEWADRDLPVWQVADATVPPAARAPFRASLAGLLVRISAYAGAHPSVYLLGLVADARQVARANGLPAPAVAASAYDSSTTWAGLITDGVSGSPDPHLTYAALAAGLTASPRLLDTLRRAALPGGWPAFMRYIPDPESTYLGVTLSRLWQVSTHNSQVRELVRAWVAESGKAAATGPAGVPALYYVLALAQELSVSVPATVRDRLVGVARQCATPSAARQAGTGLVWCVRLQRQLRLTPSATLADTTEHTLISSPVEIEALQLAYEAGEFTRSRQLLETGRLLAQQLRLPDGAYRASRSAAAPDVMSTQAGLDATGAGPEQRRQALALFTNAEGIWMLPAGSAGNITSLDSSYYGSRILAPGTSG